MERKDKNSFYIFGFILTFLLLSSSLFSCARGCGKKGTSQQTPSGLQDLNIGGVVRDEEGNPVESAFVSVKIDINGDNLFSPDETFSTMTNKDGMFFIPNELITARLSGVGEGKNLLTGRILTGRILTARMQVEVVKPGFAKNSFHADQPGFFSVNLAKASSARDKDLKDGAQFSLVSLPGRAPVLLAGKEAGRAARIKAKQEGGEVLAEINIPPELVSDSKEISGSLAYVNPVSQPELMPGSFLAYSEQSQKGFITLSSAGFIDVVLQNEKGEIISNLAPKIARLSKKQEVKKPSLKMKIPEDVYHTLYDYVEETPDKVEVPMWYFDSVKGVWIQGEELGILVDENDKPITPRELAKILTGKLKRKLYTSARVEHFSAWNVDYPVDTHAAVSGQIVDEQGKPVSGLFIQTEGNTYGGSGDWKGTYTDENGNFTVDVKKSDEQIPSRGPDITDPNNPYDKYLYQDMPANAGGGTGGGAGGGTGGGGANVCHELRRQYSKILRSDIDALRDAIGNLYIKNLISEETYQVLTKLASQAWGFWFDGDYKEMNNAIRKLEEGLKPVGRESSEQIFWERWDSLSQDAAQFALSYALDCAFDFIDVGEALKDIGGVCQKFWASTIVEEVKSKYKSILDTLKTAGVNVAYSGQFSSFSEEIQNVLVSNFTDPGQIAQNLVGKITNALLSKEGVDCILEVLKESKGLAKKASEKIGKFFSEGGKCLAKGAAAQWTFLAQTVGLFAGQAIQAWGERGEWKSAKAYETVRPLFLKFYQDYSKMLRDVKERNPQCKDWFPDNLFSPYLPFPPEKPASPRIKVKQSYQDLPEYQALPQDIKKGLDTLVNFFSMLSSVADLSRKMDKIIKGGHEYFSDGKWGVKCSFDKNKNYYVCSNSENPMDCSFSEKISSYVCTPKSDEKVFYFESASRIIAYVPAPQKKYGGETRSKLIIDGYRLKLITSLGFDISDIPSPVESSTSHHELYGWSQEAKKPYLYIGKIFLSGVKTVNIKGRFVDKAGKPVPNVPISITDSGRGIWMSSASDGTFSASLNTFKGEKAVLQFYAYYSSWSYSKNIEVGEQNEINLGDIVIAQPPRIVGIKGPKSIEKGKTADFEVNFVKGESGESPSVKWYISKYYGEPPTDIGNTEKISYTLKKSSYICVQVRDKSEGDSRCAWVTVITKPPEIKVFLSDGTELKEKTEYEFDEKTYVPLKISISDPDSPPDELGSSIYGDFPLSLSYIYSLSPVLYTGSVTQDGTFSLIFNAWDSDWNFVKKEIKIKVKNKPITPSISIFPDKVSGNAPLNVSFRVQAKDHAGYVSFDFDGDGKEDLRLYSDYVQKTFDKEGNYTVRAKVVSEDGIPAESSVNIYVFPEFKITQFSASVTQGKRPLRVNFTVQTITNASKYVWFFGDGSGAETYQNTISYTYNPRLAGTYYARVIAVSQYGTERSSNYIPITVLNSPPTIQSFSASSTSGYAPLSITFSVSATDDAGITKYKWVFGDGYIVETSTPSITHQYSAAGTFTATVTAYDTDGDTDTKSLQIQVLTQPSCDTPSVSLSANPSSGNLPLTVTFTANVSTQFTISEYSWDFNGDNVIDITTSSPTTSYTYIKSYTTTVTAKVTVVNSCGGSASASTPITITVPQKHSADFFTPVSSCVFTSASIINDASFRVSDLNGDGFQDVAVIDVSTGYLHIATGSGDGTYSYSLSLQVCSSSSPCFTFDIADFDNDGKNDVLVFDDSITSLVFFKNSVSGFSSGVSSFVSAVSDPNGVIHCSSFDIRSADLNGDGKKDVFVGCSGYSFYAFGNGNGSFSGGTTLGFNGWVRRAKISDINGDGKPDIVGLDRDNKNIFFALGNAFGVSATLTLPGGITIESFDIADFDLDSKKDIIAISSDQILYLFRNGGGTSFSFSSTANALIASPANSYLLESAEMNKDGVPDILWTAYTSSPQGLTYFDLSFQNGTTEIAFSDSYPKNTSSYFSNVDNAGPISYSPFAVVDVNNDTFDDVVMVYNNGCVVSFKRKTTVPAPQIKLGEGKISDTANKSHSLVGCSSFTAQTTYIIFLYMLLRFLFRKRKARLR